MASGGRELRANSKPVRWSAQQRHLGCKHDKQDKRSTQVKGVRPVWVRYMSSFILSHLKSCSVYRGGSMEIFLPSHIQIQQRSQKRRKTAEAKKAEIAGITGVHIIAVLRRCVFMTEGELVDQSTGTFCKDETLKCCGVSWLVLNSLVFRFRMTN